MQVAPSSSTALFGLSSEMCEVLVAFEAAGSLSELAVTMGRDISVMSRHVQRIAQTAPVLEKRGGKWRLTSLGQQISRWTQDVAATQQRILQHQTVLRLASTREFAARVLAPSLAKLLGRDAKNIALSITASEEGVERALMDGSADIGFDCGNPVDPSVRFKTVCEEPFAVVASPAFLKRHPITQKAKLIALPHLQYRRASAPALMQLAHDVPHVFATFNDIATLRAACTSGYGWAVLPVYAVKRELRDRTLRTIPGWSIRPERFGVWHLRDRKDLAPWVKRCTDWLSHQSLDDR